MSIELKWKAHTGYVQNYPDNTFGIDPEDLEGLDDDEIIDTLYQWALEDFQQNHGVSVSNTDEVIAAVRAYEKAQA